MTTPQFPFSWSRRRDLVLQACPRQYFYEYYAAREGWARDAAPRTRRIYVLKQLITRPMWAGDTVHRCIRRSLDNLRRGIRPLEVDRILDLVRDEMRAAFRASRRGAYHERPKSPALFEHEYGISVPDETWRETAEGVLADLRTFYASDLYDELTRLPAEAWLEIDGLATVGVDGVPVWVRIDAAHRAGEEIRVLDWTTGPPSQEDPTLAHALYALHAASVWRARPGALQLVEYNLARDERRVARVSEASLDEARNFIRGSVADMMQLLADPPANLPRPEEDFLLTADRGACERCKYRAVCPRFAAPAPAGENA